MCFIGLCGCYGCLAVLQLPETVSSQLRIRTRGISSALYIHSRSAGLFCTYPEHDTSETQAVLLLLLVAKEIEVLRVYIHSNGKWVVDVL